MDRDTASCQNIITDTIGRIADEFYRTFIALENNFTSGKEILGGGKETLLGGGKESLLGSKETLHNNNNIKNINNNKYNKYGNYGRITLKDNEYESYAMILEKIILMKLLMLLMNMLN